MRILSICSARPNFIKLAAVHHALAAHASDDIKHIIVHTGQHYDPLFSDIFFTQLAIPTPDENLGIHGGTREEVIERTAQACVPVFQQYKPDWILVYGDVNGALGAAQAAVQCGIKLAHVEAGLRSFDLDMPEERNRIAIDAIADLLLVSEQSGMDNLAKEKRRGTAVLVGNTMIDTVIRMMPSIEGAKLPCIPPTQFAVATFHRPSNVDTKDALSALMAFLSEVSGHIPLIFPLHRRTKAMLESFGLHASLSSALQIVEPLGYIEFLGLVHRSAFVLTDSGGIQEEATFLHKRCFTFRRNTERPSTIMSGSNMLIDLGAQDQRAKVIAFAQQPTSLQVTIPPYWDGKAGERIVATLPSCM